MDLEISRASLEKVFAEIDADRNRVLDFEEFKRVAAKWKGLS